MRDGYCQIPRSDLNVLAGFQEGNDFIRRGFGQYEEPAGFRGYGVFRNGIAGFGKFDTGLRIPGLETFREDNDEYRGVAAPVVNHDSPSATGEIVICGIFRCTGRWIRRVFGFAPLRYVLVY